MLVACGDVVVPNTGAGGATSSSSSSSGGSAGSGVCAVEVPVGCACPSSVATPWSVSVSSPGETMTTGPISLTKGPLHVAPDGSTVVCTTTYEAVGDDLVPAGIRHTKLDAAGEVVWEKADVRLFSATPDPRDCSAVLAGSAANGQNELLGQTFTCNGTSCPVVARLDAEGSLVSLKVHDHGSTAYPNVLWIAGIGGDGRISLVGSFEGTIDFGKGPLVALPAGGSGLFVAQLSPDGEALWNRHIVLAPGASQVQAFATSTAGDVAVTNEVCGTADFGEGPVPQSSPGIIVLASYDSAGNLRFGRALPPPTESHHWPTSLAYGSTGNLLAGGTVKGAWDFGGGLIGSPDELNVVVVAYDPNGQHLWSAAVASAPAESPVSWSGTLAVGPSDHIWVSPGWSEVLELSATGSLLAKHPLSGTGKRVPFAIGFTPAGAPMIAGVFNGTLDVGQGPLAAKCKLDTFVAALGP